MTNSPRIDLVGVGLNAIDTLIPLPHYPELGSKVEFHSANILPGGQVASAVIACQQWGLRTRYVGKVGEDRFADIHRREFAKAGVEAHLFTAQGCVSQQAFILVDDAGERTVLWKRDNNLTLRPEELKQEWIVEARVLHVDGHDTAAAIQAATWAKASGVPVIADLDEVYPGVQALLGCIDYLIASRDIPGRLTGEPNLRAWDGSQFHYAAAFHVESVDTTGAGDIFHAGFIYGLLQGWSLARQLDFACAAAALNCKAIGARGGIQGVEAIENLISTGERYELLSLTVQEHQL
jgi:sulfofructose kinase